MARVTISDISSASSLNANDLLLVSQNNGAGYDSRSLSIGLLSSTLNSSISQSLTAYALSSDVSNALNSKADASALNEYALSIDVSNRLSNKADTSSLTSFYEKTETSSASEINVAFNDLSNSYQITGNYLSSIPNDYKTYDDTLSSLSSNGYIMSSDLKSTIGDIQISEFQNISNPSATLRSIQDTLISVLNILRKVQENN